MLASIDLKGTWNVQLDDRKTGLQLPYVDTMDLPGTTAFARKGKRNSEARIDALTEEYAFAGHVWFSREVDIPEAYAGLTGKLHLERTRKTTVWWNDEEIGSRHSLNTPHEYELMLTPGKHQLTIRVDNTDYPTPGGHMTSKDTQTNWNGITGKIELQLYDETYLSDIQIYPNQSQYTFEIAAKVNGKLQGEVTVTTYAYNESFEHEPISIIYNITDQTLSMTYKLAELPQLWSEFNPSLYMLRLQVHRDGKLLDTNEIVTGFREFKATGRKFTINGRTTFLRGKHDGLVFPLTGFAPTTVDEWQHVLKIAMSYGFNHYRFHTCCPPEAAFTAADILGIYMEPELPFWGTITDETDENHNQAEQDYLISEGFAILQRFGNHPSFVMMSLGNELWGSKERLNAILKGYRDYDNRHLYTQGSNNFFFTPDILENEDFFCGVRFARDRLIRGSFAMCDAPQGYIQTDLPSTMKDYDADIVPTVVAKEHETTIDREDSIQIQFGTEMKTVKTGNNQVGLISNIPVISHEIGQFAMYPNFNEIEKYTGPLKARNFEVFRERLATRGMEHLAESYFQASGQLAVACYKEELEATFRSRQLAGFHLLDLQDFPGQGTALVGILDAFMDSKELISPEEWRTFCSATVLLARFDRYNYVSGEQFKAHIELADYSEQPLKQFKLSWKLATDQADLASGYMDVHTNDSSNHIEIGELTIVLPQVNEMMKVSLSLAIKHTHIVKSYDLWLYPNEKLHDSEQVIVLEELTAEAEELLEQGHRVILLPNPDKLLHTVKGDYCSDFWCYPMFRSISANMNKPEPIGTLGLFIDHKHPALKDFACEAHSTYPWWNIVMNSSSLILDCLPASLNPIVQTIDNFERNHKLGLLLECKVGRGSLLVMAIHASRVKETIEGKQLLNSLFKYASSDSFAPIAQLQIDELRDLLAVKQ